MSTDTPDMDASARERLIDLAADFYDQFAARGDPRDAPPDAHEIQHRVRRGQ